MQEQQSGTRQDESFTRHQELKQWEEPRERPDTSKCSRQENKLNKTLTNFRNTTSRGAAGGGGGILSGTEAVTSDRQQSRSGTRQGRVIIQKQQDNLDTKASCFSMSGQGFFLGGAQTTLEEGVTLDKYFGSGFQVLQLLGDEAESAKNMQSKKYTAKPNMILKQQGQANNKDGQIHETEEEYSESNKQSRVDLGVKNSMYESDQKQQQGELSPPVQELSHKTSITNDNKVKRKDFSLTGEHAVIQKKLRQKQLTKPSSNNSDTGGEQIYKVIATSSKAEQIKPSQQQQQQQQPQTQSIRLNRQIVSSKMSQYQPQQQQLENHSTFLESASYVKTQAAIIPPIHKHNPSAFINYQPQQQLSSIGDPSRNANDLSFARRKNNSSINQEVLPKQQQQSELNELPWVKPATPFSASRRKQFQYLKSKPDQSLLSASNVSAFIQPQPASFQVFSQRKDTETEADNPYDEWSALQHDENGASMQEKKGSSFLDVCKGSSLMDPGKDSSFIAQTEKLDQAGGVGGGLLLPAPSATSKQKQFAIKRVTHNNNSLHENNSNAQSLIYSSKAPSTHSPYSKEHQPLIGHSRKLSRDAQISFHYTNNININPGNQLNNLRGEPSSSSSSQQQQQSQASQKQQQTLQFNPRGDCSSLSSCQQTQSVYRKIKQMDVFDAAEAQQRVHRTSFYQNSNALNTQEQQELSGEELLRNYDNTYSAKISQENNSKSALNTKKIMLKNSFKDTTQNTQMSEDADISMRRTAKENKFIGQKEQFKQIIKKQDANFIAKYAARFNLNNL